MKWYLTPDNIEFSQWSHRSVSKRFPHVSIPKGEPDGALSIGDKTLVPLTDDGPTLGTNEVVDVRSITVSNDVATASYTYRDKTSDEVTAEREALVASMVVTRAEFANNAADAGLVNDQEAEDWAGGTKLPTVITTALATITDNKERRKARIQALTATDVRRDSPIIAMAQSSLGLTDAQVDSLFSEVI
jgi:hypothetical protein